MSDGSRFVLSIDGGTESLRVGIIDETGRIVAKASSAYSTHFPHDGWAEQDPRSWWIALIESVQSCISSSSIPIKDIEAICLDATTCTLVTLDADDEINGPALLWMDVRATEESRRVEATEHPAMKYSPTGCSAEWMLCKALWIRKHLPDRYAGTSLFLEYGDWLVHRLTGVLSVNLNIATQRWFYNARDWKFPIDLYNELGASDLEERIPESIIPAGEYIGDLTNVAANDLGLVAGVPVFAGGGDAFVASVGLGITSSGTMAMIAGSSNVFVTEAATEIHVPGIFGGFPDSIIPGLWLMEAGQVSSGSILAWYRKNFLRDLDEQDAYSIMDREAASVEEGSGGIIVLDNFQGNRSPHTDSSARGAIWGLSLGTDRAEIFRALMEGIAYGAEQILRVFRANDLPVPEIIASGGATKSELYMQIISDVTGVPIRFARESDATLVGCAVIAATGLGWYKDLPTASNKMVEIVGTIYPNEISHQRYLPLIAQHAETYKHLKELMQERERLLK